MAMGIESGIFSKSSNQLSTSTDGPSECANQAMRDTLHLEFLYPLKTLGFLQRASRHALNSPEQFSTSPGRALKPSCERCYSTNSTNSYLRRRSGGPRAFENLQSLLQAKATDHMELAWKLYGAEKPIPSAITNQLMAFLATSQQPRERERIIALGKTLGPADYTVEGADAIVYAWLSIAEIDKALLELEQISKVQPGSIYNGVVRIVAYCLHHDLWEFALQAFNISVHSLGTDAQKTIAEKVVSEVPELKSKFSAWVDSQPESFDDRLATWLASGLIRSMLEKDTSIVALDAFEVLKSLHVQNLGGTIGLEEHYAVMDQLHKYSHHQPAADLYLLYRATWFADAPTPEQLSKMLYGTLKAFGSLGDIKNMEMVFDDWFRFGSRPNEDACVYVMRQFSRYGEIAVVKEFLDYYIERFPMRTEVIDALMHTHTKRGELSEVRWWFDKLPSYDLTPSRVTYNILLNAHKQADDINGAYAAFDKMMRTQDCTPDLISFQTIMSLCANRGDAEGAEHFYHLAIQCGINPNLSMGNALVYAYVRKRQRYTVDTATGIMNRMFAAKNSVVESQPKYRDTKGHVTQMWNSVLTGYLWSGDLDLMASTYQQMRTEEVPFDSFTYAILLHGLCMNGKVTEAEQMLGLMENDMKMKPSATHYATLMLEYMLMKDITKTWGMYNRMMKANIPPTFITQALLIQVISSYEYMEYRMRGGTLFLKEAESILSQTTANLDILDLDSPDPVKSAFPPFLFVPLLQIYAREGSYKRALDLFDEFIDLSEKQRPGGTSPNIRLYLGVMNGLLRARDTALLLEIFNRAKQRALFQLSKSVYPTGLINQILDQTKGRLAPLFSVAIRALSLDGNMDAIYHGRKEYEELGFELDNVNINDLVQANSLNGRLLEAFRICEEKLIQGWSDPRTRRRGVRYEKPKFYPFMRTMEGLLAGAKLLQAEAYTPGSPKLRPLKKAQKQCPLTWNSLDKLDNVEHRIMKDRVLKAQRDEWGYPNLAVQRKAPTFDDLVFGEDKYPLLEDDEGYEEEKARPDVALDGRSFKELLRRYRKSTAPTPPASDNVSDLAASTGHKHTLTPREMAQLLDALPDGDPENLSSSKQPRASETTTPLGGAPSPDTPVKQSNKEPPTATRAKDLTPKEIAALLDVSDLESKPPFKD